MSNNDATCTKDGTKTAKRTLIGRVDEKTGEVVPTDGRVRKARERAAEPDYKALYEQALERIAGLEAEIKRLKG